MITIEQAKAMFDEMLKNSEKKYFFDQISEIAFEEPIYVMIALDENGNQVFPGEAFPSIRKKDGAIINYRFPATG